MDAIQFYRELLGSCGLTQKEGNQGIFFPGASVPVTIDKKTLVLPTDQVLKHYNEEADEIQVFHPASESSIGKDSEVFNFLKKLYRISLSIDFQSLMIDTLKLAIDTTKQEKSTKAQRAVLTQLSNVDEKTISSLESIFDKNDINGENKFIDFTMERGTEINGVKYNRVAVVHFPFWEALYTAKDKVYNVKLRKKDIDTYLDLLGIIFREFDTPSFREDFILEVGSNVKVAPSFHALTLAYLRVKDAMVNYFRPFDKVFTPINGTDYDNKWRAGLDDLGTFRTLIPSFPGNTGEVDRKETTQRHRPPASESRREIEQRKREEVAKTTDTISRPMTYAEIMEQARNNLSNSRRDSRDSNRGRNLRYDIDLSEDPDYIREREERERERHSRRSGYGRRHSRYDERRPSTRNEMEYGGYR